MYYKLAADQGEAQAQCILGIMHANRRIALTDKQIAVTHTMLLKLYIVTQAMWLIVNKRKRV